MRQPPCGPAGPLGAAVRVRAVCRTGSARARRQPPSSATSSPAAPRGGRSAARPALPRLCRRAPRSAGGFPRSAAKGAGRPRRERGRVPRPAALPLACPVSVPGPSAGADAARGPRRLRGNARKGRFEAASRPEMTVRLARRRRSRAGAMSAGGGGQRDAGAAGG